ncbi:hypothetical protein ACHWQZ_G012092 [Mnemiopsis leidyi]
MVDLWFKERQELSLGVVLTVRYLGSAIFQYTGALVYTRYGYLETFLVHAATMIPFVILAFCLVADSENLSPETCAPQTEGIFRLEEKEEEKVKEFNQNTQTPTNPLMAGKEEEQNVHKLAYLLLITLLTSVAPFGMYSVLITPYFQHCYRLSVNTSCIFLTVMTATSAISFTAAGYLLHHVSCFTTLIVSCVLLILSPLLVFHSSSQVLSVVGIVMYGVGGPLGTLSMIPCMETTHCIADKSHHLTTKVRTQIKSIWWGVWAVGGYSFSVVAGVALDNLTFEQIAISVCMVEVVGFCLAVTVLKVLYNYKMKLCLVVLLIGLVSAEPLPQGAVCDVCKAGVSQLQGLLSDSLVEKVKGGVSMVCSFLPFDQCADKVNSVIDFVVSYVKALDAHELCSKIGNCDEEDMPELEVELVGDEESCNKCVAEYEKIVSIVTAYPQVKSVIKTVLGSVCFLPIDNCSQLIDDLVEEAFEELEMGGKDLCAKIGQC